MAWRAPQLSRSQPAADEGAGTENGVQGSPATSQALPIDQVCKKSCGFCKPDSISRQLGPDLAAQTQSQTELKIDLGLTQSTLFNNLCVTE